MSLRAWIVSSLLAAGCGHIAPATVEGLPPPWPPADAPVARKAAEPAPPPAEPEGKAPEGKPVLPPLKRDVTVPPGPPSPNVPQSPVEPAH